MNNLVKDNINYKKEKNSDKNFQEIWDIMKRPNLRMVGIKAGEETHVNGTEKYFQQSHRKCPEPKEGAAYQDTGNI